VFHSISHLLIRIVVLYVFSVRALCILWILNLYPMNSSKEFLSSMVVLLNLAIISFDMKKPFNLMCNLLSQFFFSIPGHLDLCSENNCLFLSLLLCSLYFTEVVSNLGNLH
jgi:hypothetical protein